MKVISVSVERRLLAQSVALAKDLGISRASLIERGLRAVLEAVGRQQEDGPSPSISIELGLDLPRTLPSLQRSLSSQQRIDGPLQLDDLAHLLGEGQTLALAPKLRLAATKPGDQLWGRPCRRTDGGRAFRTRAHAA